MLSYHDNGHYNSVRDENTAITPISSCTAAANETPDTNSASGGMKRKKKKGRAITNTTRKGRGDREEERKENGEYETTEAEANGESREEDSSMRVEESGEANETKPSEGAKNNKNPVVLRKNDPCPCGSGLRYKKCCLAIEKSKIRAAKWKEKHEANEEREEDGGGGEDQGIDVDSPFRVLKI